mgnify:CR=1 FL=1
MNKYKDIFIKIFIKIITIIFMPLIKPQKIILMANGMNTFDGNTKYLFEYFNSTSKIHDEYKYYWITNRKDEYKRLKEKYERIIYAYSLEGIITAIKSKVFVITISPNDIIPGIFIGKNRIIIQTWHGTPIKTLGKKADKYYSYKEIRKQIDSCFNKKNTYVVSGGKYIDYLFNECFEVEEDKFLKFGYPRNDLFTTVNNIVNKDALLVGPGSKLILYCPTWREKNNFEFLNFSDGNLVEFNQFLKENNLTFMVKLHPLYGNKIKFNDELSNICVYESKVNIDTQELLLLTDILITDYSSVYFDYILMDKPVIFIPYDYEEYMKNRDFLYDYFENTPGPKVYSFSELKAAIKNALDNDDYKNARQAINCKFNNYNNFNSCFKLKKYILNKLE